MKKTGYLISYISSGLFVVIVILIISDILFNIQHITDLIPLTPQIALTMLSILTISIGTSILLLLLNEREKKMPFWIYIVFLVIIGLCSLVGVFLLYSLSQQHWSIGA